MEKKHIQGKFCENKSCGFYEYKDFYDIFALSDEKDSDNLYDSYCMSCRKQKDEHEILENELRKLNNKFCFFYKSEFFLKFKDDNYEHEHHKTRQIL